jgi:C-terminal processing protease CtpA/Prc
MPSYADTKTDSISMVFPTTPSSKWGIQTGDILTHIGKCELKEVYSYMDCLSKVISGEELPVNHHSEKANP